MGDDDDGRGEWFVILENADGCTRPECCCGRWMTARELEGAD